MDVAIRSVSAQPQSQFQSLQRVWKRNNTTSQRKNPDKICKYWIKGSCKFGDQACKFQHRWFTSDDGLFSELAQLKGHTNAINGIGLPSSSDKLCSSSSEAVRIWDCNTGQCSSVLDLGVQGGISCLITHGEEWIFVAIAGAVKVWNTHSNTERTLTAGGDVGQIYSLAEIQTILDHNILKHKHPHRLMHGSNREFGLLKALPDDKKKEWIEILLAHPST